MSILIGRKSKSGSILYISLSNEYKNTFGRITAILKNFYRTPERVEALIDLGNLHWLGGSPYKKNKNGDDVVNCESLIRDRKLSPGKHGTQYADTEEKYVSKNDKSGMINCCFLFDDDNQWYVLVASHKERLATADESVLEKSTLMYGLKVYRYNEHDPHTRLQEKNFHTWEEVKCAATKDNTPHYIFRNDRLLTVIKPIPAQAS